jgi:hypothetical protein
MNRTIRLLLALAIFAGIAVGVQPSRTEAARGWCLADPVVMIDGQLADIFVSSQLAMLTSANGPIKMVITIPKGSRGIVVLTDLGFLRGYNISFQESTSLKKTKTHTPVVVSVYAPSKKSLPVTVTFAPRSLSRGLIAVLFGMSASGTSNSWVKLSTG